MSLIYEEKSGELRLCATSNLSGDYFLIGKFTTDANRMFFINKSEDFLVLHNSIDEKILDASERIRRGDRKLSLNEKLEIGKDDLLIVKARGREYYCRI